MKKNPKKQKEDGEFKKPNEDATKHQVNIPFGKTLEKVSVYEKFVKGLLTMKRKPKYYENVTLSEECYAIIQCNFPPQLTYLGRFIILCSIGTLKIDHTLCDLWAS